MKNIIKSLMAVALLTAFYSCEDEQDLKYVTPAASFNILTPQTGDAVVLKPETPNNPALVMTWDGADFGTATSVDYSVEVDVNGNSFANPTVLTTTNSKYVSVDMATLNGAAIAAGLTPFSEGGLDVRVKATTGASEPMYSNVITYLVTPYTTESPKIYVVGNFQAASGYTNDWSPANGVPLAASGFGETDFEGYVSMNVASIEYKFVPTTESFDGDYGDNGDFDGHLLQEGEVNITATGPGYFKISANTGTLTYSATPTSWGIIGSATPTGWDSDTNMTYDPVAKVWYIDMTLTGGQEIKFRSNDDWGLNYGDTGADGSLNEGGDNIAVPSTGLYHVVLDLSHPREYTYSLTAM